HPRIVDVVIAGVSEDGMLGTFTPGRAPSTGCEDGFERSKASLVFVDGRTRGTNWVSPELFPWHLKQTSYSWRAILTAIPFRSTPETPARRPEIPGGSAGRSVIRWGSWQSAHTTLRTPLAAAGVLAPPLDVSAPGSS